MAAQDFTAELAEQLHETPKYAPSKIEWQLRDDSSDVLIFQVKVLTHDGDVLDLCGHWQRNGRHGRTLWGFALKYHGHLIRQYCMGMKHRNPHGHGRVHGPHKHRYLSSKIDRFAYKPNPPISEENPNRALEDFLAESNIELRISYQYRMF